MSKDLLREAIADAKAVRETAIANARIALEEAFTPKLQSMLSTKIAEDMEDELEEDELELDTTEENYGAEAEETPVDEDEETLEVEDHVPAEDEAPIEGYNEEEDEEVYEDDESAEEEDLELESR